MVCIYISWCFLQMLILFLCFGICVKVMASRSSSKQGLSRDASLARCREQATRPLKIQYTCHTDNAPA